MDLKFRVKDISKCTLDTKTNVVHLTNVHIPEFMNEVFKDDIVHEFLMDPDVQQLLNLNVKDFN